MEEEQRAYYWGHRLVFLMVMTVAFVASLFYFSLRTEWTTIRVILTSSILLIPILLNLHQLISPHVVVNNRGITVRSGLLRKEKAFPWGDIEKVQGKWKTEVEVVPASGASVQILFYHLSKKDRDNLRQDLHKYLGDRVKVTEDT
jgi:hypothetical protein